MSKSISSVPEWLLRPKASALLQADARENLSQWVQQYKNNEAQFIVK